MTEVGDALVVIVRNFSAASEACGADRTDKKSQQRLEWMATENLATLNTGGVLIF